MKTPAIILPTTRIGRIRLGVRDAAGRLKHQSPWSKNMILDSGLAFMQSTGDYLDTCHVGTGDAAVSAEQTTLAGWLASTDNRTSANCITTTEEPYIGISQITYQFAQGAVIGTVKEIGFGPNIADDTTLFNRALVRDAFGNQSFTIVDADESLQVEYEISNAAPTEDVVGTIMHNNAPVGYTARAALATSTGLWCPYNGIQIASTGKAAKAGWSTTDLGGNVVAFAGAIGAANLQPGGDSANARWLTELPYVEGSFRSLVRAEWSLDDANFPGGIRSLLWFMRPAVDNGGNSFGAYQLEFDDPIMKTSSLGFRIDLGISWGR